MKIFRTVLCAILTVVLAVLLCVMLVVTAVSASVRLAFTPENLYQTMEEINFASLQFPDGYGGFATVLELVNEVTSYYGMDMTENDLNELFRMLSIDDILSIFVQDFRTWLMDYGPVPVMDPYEMAELALSGLDQEILELLSVFSDPRDTVAAFLYRISDLADLEQRLEALEPVRLVLAKGTIVLEGSVCLLFALLILAVNGLKKGPFFAGVSTAAAAAGGVMLFAPTILNDWKNYMLASLSMPESTFNIVYLPLLESVRSLGAKIALGGLTVLIFTVVIWIFSSMIRREKELAEKLKAERMNRFTDAGF